MNIKYFPEDFFIRLGSLVKEGKRSHKYTPKFLAVFLYPCGGDKLVRLIAMKENLIFNLELAILFLLTPPQTCKST